MGVDLDMTSHYQNRLQRDQDTWADPWQPFFAVWPRVTTGQSRVGAGVIEDEFVYTQEWKHGLRAGNTPLCLTY